MKFYIYRVEKIEDYRNIAPTIDYDFTEDFEDYKKCRGYVKVDYYIADTDELTINEVYCTGRNLIKPLEKIGEFENEPRTLKFT